MNEQKKLVNDEGANGTSTANNNSESSTVIETPASVSQPQIEIEPKKKKKKLSFLSICLIACGAISVLLILLAIITKESLFNKYCLAK